MYSHISRTTAVERLGDFPAFCRTNLVAEGMPSLLQGPENEAVIPGLIRLIKEALSSLGEHHTEEVDDAGKTALVCPSFRLHDTSVTHYLGGNAPDITVLDPT